MDYVQYGLVSFHLVQKICALWPPTLLSGGDNYTYLHYESSLMHDYREMKCNWYLHFIHRTVVFIHLMVILTMWCVQPW